MKKLMDQIAENATTRQKDLTRLCEELNKATTRAQQVKYIKKILAIYDEMLLFVNFYISNEENIANILDGRDQAVKAYKQITGEDYKGTESDE